MTINMNSRAASLAAPAFAAYYIQARWSLSTGLNAPVDIDLQVVGRQQTVSVDENTYRSANPLVDAQDRRGNRQPQAYCVRDGQVRLAKPPSSQSPSTPEVPLLDQVQNHDIVRAAIAANRRSVAIVRQEGGGRAQQRLLIATVPATGSDTVQPTFAQTGLYRSIQRPIPLPASNNQFLVIADDIAYLATSVAGSGAVTMTPLAGGERMSALAPAPDGRRLAYVTGNQLLLGSLRADGSDQLTLGQPRREIRTPLAEHLAVGWLSEDRLVVGGRAAGVPGLDTPLVEVSVDGTRLQGISRSLLGPNLVVTGVATVPDSPTTPLRYLMTIEAANNRSYDVFGTTLLPLACNPLAGPAPSQGPTTNVAPFFEG
jgi:hypothetical protein